MNSLSKYVAGLALAAAFTLTAGLPGSIAGTPAAFAAGDCTVTDTTFDAEEKRFAELINEYRRQNGLPALAVSSSLNRMATWHAVDMARKGYFSHEDSLGRRAEARGADCGTPKQVGENIAAGPYRSTAQNAFDAWKNSEGHNRNMLNAGYKQIGIARHYDPNSQWGWYWVTDFSLNSDGTNLLTGNATVPAGTDTPARTTTPVKTATPVPTKTPAATTAAMTSPVPGSRLSSTTQTFKWTSIKGASNYQIYVGTTPGGYNVRNVRTTSTSVSLSGLPRGNVTLYVRLWTQVGATWTFVDYTYTAAK